MNMCVYFAFWCINLDICKNTCRGGRASAVITKGTECVLNTSFFNARAKDKHYTQPNFTALLYCEYRHCCLVTAMSKK